MSLVVAEPRSLGRGHPRPQAAQRAQPDRAPVDGRNENDLRLRFLDQLVAAALPLALKAKLLPKENQGGEGE